LPAVSAEVAAICGDLQLNLLHFLVKIKRPKNEAHSWPQRPVDATVRLLDCLDGCLFVWLPHSVAVVIFGIAATERAQA